jgi:biofilm PGA synthesis N-glycosyltransferase PgaC
MMSANLVITINLIILAYFVFMAILYTVLLFSAYPDIRNYFTRFKFSNIYDLLKSKKLAPVSIIIPVFNERHGAIEAIKSALNSDYHKFEVIVVNDESTDDTMQILVNEFKLVPVPNIVPAHLETAVIKQSYISHEYPRLLLIDKFHGGAGDCINVGINASTCPYIMTFDADSIMEPNTISELMYSILTEPHAIAVGGAVYVLNECVYKNGKIEYAAMPHSLIPALQTNEYLRSHLFNRTAWNRFGGTVSYSGTATIFEKEAVIAVNGFDKDNFAQDAEIIMRLHKYMREHKYPYRIFFNPNATAWTDVPANLTEYAVQRNRWQRGLLRSVFRNISIFFNPKYRLSGLFAYPIYLISEVFSPFIELAAYVMVAIGYSMGIITWEVTLLYIVLAWGFITYLTMANVLLNYLTFNRYNKKSDIYWMLLLTFIEMFGFHQFQVLVRVWASIQYFINRILGRPL